MVCYSYWIHAGFRLAQIISDCVFRFQIALDSFHIAFRLVWKNRKNFRFCLHISDCFILAGASIEEENSVASAATEEEEDLQHTDLEQRIEAAADNLERRMEAALEASEISKRGMKEAFEEAKVKVAALPNMLLKPQITSIPQGPCPPQLPQLPPRPHLRGSLLIPVLLYVLILEVGIH